MTNVPVAPRRSTAWVGVVVGLVVVAALVARGHDVLALVLVVVVAVTTVARAASPSAERVAVRVLAAIAAAVAAVLSLLLLGVLALVVLFPVWLVARLLRWDALDAAGTNGGWLRRRTTAWTAHPDRPFGDDRLRMSGRSRAHAASVVLVPLALAFLVLVPLRQPAERLLGSWLPGGDAPPAVTVGEAPVDDSVTAVAAPEGDPPDGSLRDIRMAHQDVEWARDYYEELFPLDYAYDGFLTLRMADTEGRYVNVVDRARRSYEPADSPEALDVWFLGSSALYGLGQRDDHTIPSEVVRLAEEAGLAVRAHNFGVPSYRGWQDALLLAQLLGEREAPDLIVTYEGYNDVNAYLPPGSPTQVQPQFADAIRDALLAQGAVFGGATHTAQDPIPRTASWSPQNVGDVFGRSAALQRDLAAARDIPIAQYLQPSLWTRDLPVDDATLANIGADRSYHRSYGDLWDLARAEMAVDGVVDLGDALDHVDSVVYGDDVHTNEAGARAVAEAMFSDLRPTLEQLAAAPPAEG